MKVHRGIEHLPVFTRSVVTIGTFDGVHEGHRKIIATLVAQAKGVGGESVIITFDPHPRKIIRPHESLQLINTLDEKIELLASTGLDHLVIVPFTTQFSEFTAEEYVEDFLVKRFNPHTIIIGYDHHFGKGRGGNYRLLEEKAEDFRYQLLEIPKHTVDHIGISSTRIREAILGGNIEEANRLLGYEFFFGGKVVAGDRLGRKLGYPTANLVINNNDKIHPGDGVYAAYVDRKGKKEKGMLSIGTRPTLASTEYRVEVNIFDFDEEIYGENLRVTIKKFLRAQERYGSLEDLKEQMARDRVESLKYLADVSRF